MCLFIDAFLIGPFKTTFTLRNMEEWKPGYRLVLRIRIFPAKTILRDDMISAKICRFRNGENV